MLARSCKGLICSLAVLYFFSTDSAWSQASQSQANAPAAKEWQFVVSGDSRNCGDLIMPAIAAGAVRHQAAFYWHLGDFRWISQPDQDILRELDPKSGMPRKAIAIDQYRQMAWDDFLKMQIAAFEEANVPVFLGIGNHETIAPKDRSQYLDKFARWLDTPALKEQRLRDDPNANRPKSYYRWQQDGLDFITLDNATPDQFDETQLDWFNQVVERDRDDARIRTIVVGMHEALPDSLGASHSMSNFPEGVQSGRLVYKDLAKAEKISHKHVYILASHSHFFMENIFDSPFWRASGEPILSGWIVGTAGAYRYRLPDGAPKNSRTNVYGYLLGTVNAGGQPGIIKFEFQEIRRNRDEGEDFVPAEVWSRFSADMGDVCFNDNKEQ